MQSYPLGKTNFATSVTSASFSNIANFLTANVSTASFAANFPGPQGPSGSTYTNIGIEGPQGPSGSQGPQGFGVYLLSSSLATCAYTFSLGRALAPSGTAEQACIAIPSTYYSDQSPLGFGVTIYTDLNLTIVPDAGYYSDGTTAWSFDGGVIDNLGVACAGGGDGGEGGGGGGICGTSCGYGQACPSGCYCSVDENSFSLGTCQEPEPI